MNVIGISIISQLIKRTKSIGSIFFLKKNEHPQTAEHPNVKLFNELQKSRVHKD